MDFGKTVLRISLLNFALLYPAALFNVHCLRGESLHQVITNISQLIFCVEKCILDPAHRGVKPKLTKLSYEHMRVWGAVYPV